MAVVAGAHLNLNVIRVYSASIQQAGSDDDDA
jgi:hypothetical protein